MNIEVVNILHLKGFNHSNSIINNDSLLATKTDAYRYNYVCSLCIFYICLYAELQYSMLLLMGFTVVPSSHYLCLLVFSSQPTIFFSLEAASTSTFFAASVFELWWALIKGSV